MYPFENLKIFRKLINAEDINERIVHRVRNEINYKDFR